MNIFTLTSTSPRIIYCGMGFVLTLLSGFLLSKLGRPLNSAVFTVHKLAAVGTIILIGMVVFSLIKEVDFHALYLAMAALATLLFLALLVSGALLSFDKLALPPVLLVHQLAPLFALVFSMFSLYLLINNKS